MNWRTWAIDEDAVEADGYTWEEMYRKQRRVPGLILALITSSVYLTGEWLYVILGIPFVLFSAWPALGAYTHMQQERSVTGVDDRGQVQMVDVVMTFFLVVALVVLAPVWMTFTDMVAGSADPFTRLLLMFSFPLLLIALLLSVGISARRGGP